MKRLAVLAALACAFCLPIFAQAPGAQEAAGKDAAKDAKPQSAPGFALKNLRGKTVRLEDYRGKIVLVNFWATWCAPCHAEMPELVKLQKKYASRLQILGVSYEPEEPASVGRVARKFKIPYPLLIGSEALSRQYQIEEVLPVTVVVGRDGEILDRINGMLEPEDIEKKILPRLQ